jgi:hypothetical protein
VRVTVFGGGSVNLNLAGTAIGLIAHYVDISTIFKENWSIKGTGIGIT